MSNDYFFIVQLYFSFATQPITQQVKYRKFIFKFIKNLIFVRCKIAGYNDRQCEHQQ